MDSTRHPVPFHGTTLKDCQTAEFSLTENAYQPNLEIPKHWHEHAFLGIVLRGTLTEYCGTQTCLGRPWTVIYHPAGEIHSTHLDSSGAHVLNIAIARPKLDSVSKYCAKTQKSFDFAGKKQSWLGARLYEEFCQMDELSAIAIEGLVLELLAEIFRQGKGATERRCPAWLEQAREIVHDQFMEHLTLSYIAKTVGVHPVHLAREFSRHYRCTVGELVRKLRIEYACREISQDGTSLAEIALASGFSDQSNFSKTFKKVTGFTPLQYQRVVCER